ncbi:MAG: WD40 repeat domain-containing protein [Acetobacteraceae bacterium]
MENKVGEADLLASRGESRTLEAFVVDAAFERGGRFCAFALGDGSLAIVEAGASSDWRNFPVHDGAVLALAPHALAGAFLTGGDDGALRVVEAEGTARDIARFGSRWVEHVASHAGEKGSGLIAAAAGRTVHLFDAAGQELRSFEHPSTATAIAFGRKGKRIAVSHYNGASLWFVSAKTASPRTLEWKGSHIAVAIHPEDAAVVTAMQDNALHGWDLSDGKHMRMTGYPGKTESLSFSRRGKWLATSGAEGIVMWPFFGDGPMGKPPLELAASDGVSATRVACHPQQDVVAGGFADGHVVLVDIDSGRVLPVAQGGHGAVSALAWSPDGARLAFGTEQGLAAIVDLARR